MSTFSAFAIKLPDNSLALSVSSDDVAGSVYLTGGREDAEDSLQYYLGSSVVPVTVSVEETNGN